VTKEKVYDTKIEPLMEGILEVCKTHKISMLASFHIPEHDEDTLFCTSALMSGEFRPPDCFVEALRRIAPLDELR